MDSSEQPQAMTNAEILKALKDALHDLETTHGLYVNDGDARAQFRLEHKSIAALARAIDA